MHTLNIQGQKVKVGDKFLSLSPEQQNATVDEIAKSLNITAPAEPVSQPSKKPMTPEQVNSKYGVDTFGLQMDYGMASHGLGQGTLLGFGDEINAGGAALAAKMQGMIDGRSVNMGTAYDEFLESERSRGKKWASDNPGLALTSELAGGLASGGIGAVRSGAVNAGKGLLKNSMGVAKTGAATGAVYGAGASEAEDSAQLAEDSLYGGLLGASTSVLPSAVIGGVRKGTNKVLATNTAKNFQKAVDKLKQEGIPLTTGQQLGSKALQNTETTLSGSLLGGTLAKRLGGQREKFQGSLMQKAGFADEDIAEGLITKEAIEAAQDKFSQRYTEALGGKIVQLGGTKMDKALSKLESDYLTLLPSQQKKEVVELVNDFARETKIVNGERYQALRSILGQRQRANETNDMGSFYGELKGLLDQQFDKAVGATEGLAKRQIDADYANFQSIKKVYERNGGAAVAEGFLPLASLNRTAKNKAGRTGATRDFFDLVNAGSQVLADKTANSGTAPRMLNNIIGYGGFSSVLNPDILSKYLLAAGGGYLGNNLLAKGVGGSLNRDLAESTVKRIGQGGLLMAPMAVAAEDKRKKGLLFN